MSWVPVAAVDGAAAGANEEVADTTRQTLCGK